MGIIHRVKSLIRENKYRKSDMMSKRTKKMVLTALMMSMVYVATTMIKIPTPTMGYIHFGDCVVLLCGYLLGPGLGALAAGIGSMFSDVLSPYIIYAPGTLIIKALNAIVASNVFIILMKSRKNDCTMYLLISGILAEIIMVLGYFGYDILVAVVLNREADRMTLAVGIIYAAASVPFYIIKALVNIVIATILYPILKRV